MQRWPAVPAAANTMARMASSRSARRRDDPALLPPSSSSDRPKRAAHPEPTARPIRTEPVADRAGRAASSTAPRRRSRAADHAGRRGRAATPTSGSGPRRAAPAPDRGQRRLLRGLPHDRVAAHQREHGVPRPDRDGEVERGDDADRPERMPLSPSCGDRGVRRRSSGRKAVATGRRRSRRCRSFPAPRPALRR